VSEALWEVMDISVVSLVEGSDVSGALTLRRGSHGGGSSLE
jgi:hypothetical protein